MSLDLNEKELAAIRAEFCQGFTDEQFDVAMAFCRVRNLLPGKHVVFQLRNSNEWDEVVKAKVKKTRIIFITTIDASRLIAQRTGLYGGQGPEDYIYLDEHGSPSVISPIPLPQTPLPPKGTAAAPREPWAVRTTIYRKDFEHPITSVARFDAYASTYESNGEIRLNAMWAKRGPEQLAKCSEMLSLRKAFPEELGQLYIQEEFKSEEEPVAPTSVTPASVVPILPSAPAVNQTPAEATDKPRPGESGHTSGQSVQTTTEQVIEKVPVEKAKEAAIKAAPDLKPASELPAPKKRGPKPKAKATEETKPAPVDGITQSDIDLAGQPVPEFDKAANQREAQEFVEAVTSFTEEQAKEAGLPPPPDPLPSADQLKEFVARARKLAEPGADIKKLGDYTLGLGKKTASKYLTVGDWTTALGNLEKAKAEGKLKELVNSVPEPPLGEF